MRTPALKYPLAAKGTWYADEDFERRGGRLVWESPDDYLASVRALDIDDVSRDNIDDLKKRMQRGRPLDPLARYADGKEDGRHRAHAARELGISRVPVLVFGRKNPSVTGTLAEHVEDFDGDFDDHFGEDPEDVLAQGEPRYGRKVVWVGSPGKMVEIDPDFAVSMPENQFDSAKLAAVASAVRESSARTNDGKPVLYVGYGTVQLITQRNVDEVYEDDVALDRPLDAGDIGKLSYTLRDGNHRTFGALIGGETKVWMNLEANQLQDVEAWRNRRRKPLPEYQSKNRAHMKLMRLLDEKLRSD